MAFDANGVICADIQKASFALVSANEIRKTSVCRVFSAVAFDGEHPRAGGLHDPRLGPLDDSRRADPCQTCGGKDDCPGHLGHIDLYLPAYHPLFIADLIRLLKACCLVCSRFKMDAGQATRYLKRFQMVQAGEIGLLARFDAAYEGLNAAKGGRRRGEANDQVTNLDNKLELTKILRDFRHKELELRKKDPSRLVDLREDISETATSIEAWRRIRSELLEAGASGACPSCGNNFPRRTIRKGKYDGTIDVTWPYASDMAVTRPTLMRTLDATEEMEMTGEADLGTVRDARVGLGVDDETIKRDSKMLGRRGADLGSASLAAYQVLPILRRIFSGIERPLLNFIFPEAESHGHKFFFLEVIPVSANKFRPRNKSDGFGGGGRGDGGGILHPRTNALMDILNENAKVGFSLITLRYTDVNKALETQMGGMESAVPPNIVWRDTEKLGNAINEHRGNYAQLHNYCRDLQLKINSYIDSTKSGVRNPPPAIRQWLEKKQGAIRQKMMGKRVNYAARTTIAPDAMINTNEIGIPMPFAMKLTIAEYAVPHNVELLCRLVMNGPRLYPGCNMIIDPTGRRMDLLRRELSEHRKRTLCKELRNHVAQQVAGGGLNNTKMGRPYAVYRHLRDGDVVVMNRQPSLHRASMMAHFIRVLTGQKTFRLNYANCGSYNADFDGDEMNMHLPQDHTARAEAAFVINSDCNYTVVKSGEPLRGLIQDHVLGGNFLTVRGTFLTRDQYCNLIYVGVAAFIDKGERFNVDTKCMVVPEFSAGDPFARALGTNNIRVVTDPPTIWKPQPLWTGKQVITAVMKTLIDSIAIRQFGRNGDGSINKEFIRNYRGINLTSKSKTPGNAWNGVLDKDTEEARVVIRHSELLQGVFDKSQFGASSYGLVHLCYELMGPRVAGTLLSVFSRIFTNWLQQRGFSCSSGDFQMTSKGERTRADLIMRITAAGTYLQESFVDAVHNQMHWQEKMTNTHGVQSKYVHVGKAMSRFMASQNDECGRLSKRYVKHQLQEFSRVSHLDAAVTSDGLVNKNPKEFVLESTHIPPNWPADPNRPAAAQVANVWLTAEQRELFRKRGLLGLDIGSSEGPEDEVASDPKKGDSRRDEPTAIKSIDCNMRNTWNQTRFLYTPKNGCDWRKISKDELIAQISHEIDELKRLGSDNDRIRRQILHMLSSVPDLSVHFPNVAKLLGTDRLWGPGPDVASRRLVSAGGRALGLEPPPAPMGRMGPPLPNKAHLLLSGKLKRGDGALRVPKLYHPSWCWQGENTTRGTELPFESPLRYVSRLLQINEQRRQYHSMLGRISGQQGEGGGESVSTQRPYLVFPSELTRMRMERLIEDYFAGRQDVFLTMFDKFFQGNMGKLSSKNNDLVSGDVTLYPFPRNGFSSMVTTGAKGSKVNFAMICGMLSQQSLEGKRVPLMISGKTHPSFGVWDLGARAGGLITDRFLTGLRPPDYFFHCMAGREGLVDTAVKTARSGYLQRCVMKSLEGMTIAYDGSVRESDGSVIQFTYGEDGTDVCRMSYLDNLNDLLANPAIIQAKYGSKYKLSNKQLAARLARVQNEEILRRQKEREVMGEATTILEPLSKELPPLGFPGSISEAFAESAQKQLSKVLASNHIIRHDLVETGLLNESMIEDTDRLWWDKKDDGSDREMTALSRLIRLKYTNALADPGDAVGCLAAQSMGEPATQMTLNTFHLAGHGAANVTLGIPRLREILQTAGDAATPVLYIPIKGDEKAEYTKNASKVMLGFRKINLADIVNSVGVEANVFWQPVDRRLPEKSGNPEYNNGLYDKDPNFADPLGKPRKFWQYETTIQFENLEHFCKVVPKYTPQKIVNFTINRVVKEMMRTANRLMAVYCTKMVDEVWDSEDDELGFATERYLYERNLRTIIDKKKAQRELYKAAGVGFGGIATGGFGNNEEEGGDGGDLDLMTSADAGMIYRKGNANRNAKGGEEDDAQGEADAEEEDGALPDSEQSVDDSEEDLSDPEGIDAEAQPDEEEADAAVETGTEVEEGGSDAEDADTEAEDKIKRLTNKKRAAAKSFPGLEKWKYDKRKRILAREKPIEATIHPDQLEEEALWSDGKGAGFRSKQLPDEAFRYMMDLKVCNKSWRIVVKFGWPFERCPRRIEFLPSFTRIIQKQTLQGTPGVANPHCVGEADATTSKTRGSKKKVACEIQCEGSNLQWVSQLSDECVDHTKISTNDIRAMFKFYGVECGRACVISELARVFGVYGIDVNFRHLSLIADAMTASGQFRAFSRMGMQHNPSPLLQMSFETSIKFLTEGVERGAIDNLRTPAGAIVVGRNTSIGTGMSRPLTMLKMRKRNDGEGTRAKRCPKENTIAEVQKS